MFNKFNSLEIEKDLEKHIMVFFEKNKDYLLKHFPNLDHLDNKLEVYFAKVDYPLNMKYFLHIQCDTIKKELGEQLNDSQKRSQLVNNWIQNNACDFRSKYLNLQKNVFVKIKHRVLKIFNH